MQFVACDDKGHSVVMDVSREHGGEGSGFGPMQLLLLVLGGCTGMDIVEIMRKQRQKLESLELIVSGERVAEHPRVYGKVHVEYMFGGKELKEKAVQRAVHVSEQVLFCGCNAKAYGQGLLRLRHTTDINTLVKQKRQKVFRGELLRQPPSKKSEPTVNCRTTGLEDLLLQ